MRNGYALLLAAVLCLCGQIVYGQSGKRNSGRSRNSSRNAPTLYVPLDSISVDMSLAHAPVYNTDGKKTRIGAGNLPEAFRNWMVNDISFRISYRPGKKALPLPLENLKVELYIYAPGPSRDGESFRWFCGVQNLQCVVADPEMQQRKYWASLFLPPSYVYLHFPLDRGKTTLRALEGVVIIADKDNNVLGRKVFGYGSRTKLTAARMQTLSAAAGQLRGKKTKNQVMLWPREKTPWAWLEADRFEFPALDPGNDPKAAGAAKPPVPPAEPPAKENEE